MEINCRECDSPYVVGTEHCLNCCHICRFDYGSYEPIVSDWFQRYEFNGDPRLYDELAIQLGLNSSYYPFYRHSVPTGPMWDDGEDLPDE